MLDLKEKMKANPKQKKKNKKAAGVSGALPLETNGQPVTGGEKVAAAGQEPSDEDEEDEVSSTNSSLPPSGNKVGNTHDRFDKIVGTLKSQANFILKLFLQPLLRRKENPPQQQRAETNQVHTFNYIKVTSTECISEIVCMYVTVWVHLYVSRLKLAKEKEASLHAAHQYVHGPSAQRGAAAGLHHSGLCQTQRL